MKSDTPDFERFFLLHRRFVYGFCFRMTRNIQEAEDLTQEVFFKLYLNLSTLREHETSLRAWLGRVAFRDALKHLARRKRFSSLEEILQQHPGGLPRKTISVCDKVISLITLERALKELSEKRSKYFVLKYLYGFEHQEIAQLMDCVPGTSKSECSKACAAVLPLLGHINQIASEGER